MAVLIKQIPKISQLRLDPETFRLIREHVDLEPNMLDMVALGAALKLREEVGGEVTAVTMGPPQAADVLKAAHLGGADHLILISDRALQGSDTLATARALADALRPRGFDLILAGKHSLDSETGQVGPMVAELLGLPVATGVSSLKVDRAKGRLEVWRETEAGHEALSLPYPAVISAAENLAEEVYISRKKVAAAPDVPHEHLGAGDLSGPMEHYGDKGSPTVVEGIREEKVVRDQVRATSKTPQAQAEELAHYLSRRPSGDFDAEPSQPFAGEIWVYCPPHAGAVHPVAKELLGEAYRMTSAGGGRTAAVLLGEASASTREELARSGADRLYLAGDPALSRFLSDRHADVVSRAIGERRPDAVLFPATPEGRELASLVSARLSLGLTGDIVGLHPTGRGLIQDKPAFGGNFIAPITSTTRPDMATVRPGVFEPLAVARGQEMETVEISGRTTGRDVVAGDVRPLDLPAGLLTDRGTVLSVGYGVGEEGAREILRLAKEKGFGLAASRSVTDSGWLPKAFQVGLTGRSIAPDVYLALGISGAFEHLVGLRRARTIVAVNPDPDAPIFEASDFGIVGEWEKVLPALLSVLQPSP